MTKEIVINYNWKCNEGVEVPEKHVEALEEDAQDRIFEMIKKGYYQGELHTSVRFGKEVVPEENEDDGLTYSGWWSIKKNDK
jgi:hypothetical protein